MEAQTETPTTTTETPKTEVTPVEPTAQSNVTTEAETKEAPATEEKEDKLSTRFAALTRKERIIREKEAAIKEQMKAVEEAKTEAQRIIEKKKLAKMNPMEWLQEAGLTYDEITQFILNDKKPSPDSKFDVIRQENEALRKELQEWKQQQELQKQTQIIQSFKSQINDFVQSSDKHELIKTLGETETVYNVIDQHAAETGRLMNIDEACDIVEAYLEEQEQARLQKLMNTKKFQTKKPEANKPEPSKEAKTLSNTTDSPPRLEEVMDPEKRKKLAAQLIKFD